MSAISLPSRASDAGPDVLAVDEDERKTWDGDDWIFEARWQAKKAVRVICDDPAKERKQKLEFINAAIDALQMAKDFV